MSRRRPGSGVLLAVAWSAVWLCACAAPTGPRAGAGQAEARGLADDVVRGLASAPALRATRARLITDNDTAFEAKLEAIQNARREIALAYYIYSTTGARPSSPRP